MNLSSLGWTPHFESSWTQIVEPGFHPARVAAVHRGACSLLGHPAVDRAEPIGRLRGDPLAAPAVGDWVAIDPGLRIAAVLPRRSAMVRRAAGQAHVAQVIAANVDVVFVVTSLNADLNPRRIERYLALVWDSGAAPVLVLTKADLASDIDAACGAVAEVAVGVPIVITSVVAGSGVGDLLAHLGPGRTGALVGSSGVGKSSLLNALLGRDLQRVEPIREGDERGRHTTSHRELFLLAGGGLLVDTPGMREVGMWSGDVAVEAAFADVDSLAASCRFRSCGHDGEPGCAVEGGIDPDRLASWRKLQRERAHAARQQDQRAARDQRQRWKAVHVAQRARRRIDPKLRDR